MTFKFSWGGAIHRLSLDFEKTGVIDFNPVPIFDESMDDSKDFTFSLQGGYSFTPYFALGLRFDYNHFSLKGIKARFIPPLAINPQPIQIDDGGEITLFSLFSSLTGKYPLEIQNWILTPYLQLGLGIHIYSPDLKNGLEIKEETTLGIGLAVGLEIAWSSYPHLSFIIESRWVYNQNQLRFRPQPNSEFKGDLDLSYLSFCAGVKLNL